MTVPKTSDPLVRLVVSEVDPVEVASPVSTDESGATQLPRRGGQAIQPAKRSRRQRRASDVARDQRAHRSVPDTADVETDDVVSGTEFAGPDASREVIAASKLSAVSAKDRVLDELTSVIEYAVAFSERWDERYRSDVFRVALDRLSAIHPGAVEVPRASGGRTARTVAGQGGPGAMATAVDGAEGYQKLARALDLDIDSLERLVAFDDKGKLHILARVEGKTRRELQTKYSLAYLYVKEVGFGDRLVDVEELRDLCVEHACYDMANFTGNFAKDATAGLIRQHGEKGTRTRKFLLSKKGLDRAAELLRELATE
jgi:hypothetical protein